MSISHNPKNGQLHPRCECGHLREPDHLYAEELGRFTFCTAADCHCLDFSLELESGAS